MGADRLACPQQIWSFVRLSADGRSERTRLSIFASINFANQISVHSKSCCYVCLLCVCFMRFTGVFVCERTRALNSISDFNLTLSRAK